MSIQFPRARSFFSFRISSPAKGSRVQALLYGRTLCQQALQLLGAHILAAVQDDHVLFASGEEVIAILVHPGQVAGMEPALGVHHLSGALRVLIVAQHHIAAPHTQLAVVQLDLAVTVVLADGAR